MLLIIAAEMMAEINGNAFTTSRCLDVLTVGATDPSRMGKDGL
jgi:hypothetical protein